MSNGTCRPAIITLDSYGTPHPDAAEKLKEYLVLEGQKKTKTKHSLCFETSDIRTVLAKDIPQQKNSYDCGVFIMWYFKVFLQSPDDLVDGLLQGKVNEEIWLNMTASIMREDMIRAILDLLKKQGIDVVGMETGTESEPSSPSPPQSDLESPFRWEYRKRKSSFQDTSGKESCDDANNGDESLPTDSHCDGGEVAGKADIGDRDDTGRSVTSPCKRKSFHDPLPREDQLPFKRQRFLKLDESTISHDLKTLEPAQCVNAKVVLFCLHYILDQRPSIANGGYIYDPAFYSNLNDNVQAGQTINYEAVRRLGDLDIFRYNFAIIPISHGTHWYVAIIWNLSALAATPWDTGNK